MRKALFTAGCIVSMNFLFAQEPLDAVRYSWLSPQGTARAQALGGAVSALGGDITALYTNPAGIGIYKTSELVLTPGITFNNVKSTYRGTAGTDDKTSFNYGPLGVVWGIPSYKANSKWKGMSVGLAISKTANFNGNTYVSGENNESSYSEKYIDQIYGDGMEGRDDVENVLKDLRYSYGPTIAFLTYLIDTITYANDEFGYFSSASDILRTGGPLKQQQIISTKGGITDFNIGMGGNYNDVFYIGGSINISTLKYIRESSFKETDSQNNPGNYFNYFVADDYLKTDGTGVSINLGIILKPVEALRVGLNFRSPTWYSFKDTYYASLTTDTETYAGVQSRSSLDSDLNDGYAGEYTYRYKTPLRIGAGLAYIFGTQADVSAQKGFVTADVEYVSYKNNAFNTQDNTNQGDKDYFNDLNRTMDQVFKSAINFRLGGELKFETLMVRAGFGYYGNPYTNDYFGNRAGDITNASRMNISGGLGWRNKGMFVDLAYIHQIVKDAYYPYRLDEGVFNASKLNYTIGNILLTIGFKF
ncbi:MAG: outer membrane protein transport protein [Chitinophagaceae bacterium]|nr:outer membrane protein transport protein [Chitinophagaceae bacterium]